MPATVADVVGLRVATLSERARELLAVVAAAGGHAAHPVLERCLQEPGSGPALREALDAGLLVRDRGDEGVALRHGLIGEVIYDGLVPAERAALHQAIARALHETGAPAARLADQWQRAGAHADALAASLEAGGQAARAYAFAEASAHYERALALWDVVRPEDGDRVALLSRAAQAARYSGAQPRGARARAGRARGTRPRGGPSARRAPVRAPRRVPLVGRRGGARVLRGRAGAAPGRADAAAGAAARRGGARADGPAALGGIARAL